MIRSILACTTLLALMLGCNQLHVVRLHSPEDYSPPRAIPFASTEDKKVYEVYFERGWMDGASNYVSIVNLRESTVRVEGMVMAVPSDGLPKAAMEGYLDGRRMAKKQVCDLVDKAFQDVGQPPFWADSTNTRTPPNPNPEGIGVSPKAPNKTVGE